MVSVERTFVVNKPVDVVVDYLKDFSRAEYWDPGTKSCRRNDSGPIGEGSTWDNVSEFWGRETRLTYTLIRLEPNRLTFVGQNKTATTTDDITLSPRGSDTSISYHADIEFSALAKLAAPLMGSELKRLGDGTEDQLTRALNNL
ncbi:SRPBCC family protein [Pseudonocardia sp. KRD291]|uniref:SRPBCC family protein n=1 Tax=Pseudonocardia sp. KRD291 TaxID=2792007 RepID=UPI001C49E5A4|nr:SRPBCC family protein [Pseudonocardia sp. KRD291]MBW0100867.1 SRPBCC family protein [Pseudonocardia sp. KRD291]